MIATASSDDSRAEAERQLAASVARHREGVASMQELGRPEAGPHLAVKSVGRAVQLVSFSLKHAAALGIPFERLVELTGWEPVLVREGLEPAVARPWVMGPVAAARGRAGARAGRGGLVRGERAPAGASAARPRRRRRRGGREAVALARRCGRSLRPARG